MIRSRRRNDIDDGAWDEFTSVNDEFVGADAGVGAVTREVSDGPTGYSAGVEFECRDGIRGRRGEGEG